MSRAITTHSLLKPLLVLAFVASAVALTLATSIEPNAPAAIEPDGTLDTTFNAGSFTNGQVWTSALQVDGKLLIGGEFSKVHGVTRLGLARLNPDGTLDPSFDPGTAAALNVESIAIQPDGKIIVKSVISSVNLARLNADGSRDTSYDPAAALSRDGLDDGAGHATNRGYANSFVLQPDGKIVVVGLFYYVVTGPGQAVARSGIARFDANGAFDPSFDPGKGFEGTLDNSFDPVPRFAVRQQLGSNAGKIVVEGNFEAFDEHYFLDGFVRINSDGSFDSSFNAGSGPGEGDNSVYGFFVQSDDKLIVVGNFTSFNGGPCSGIVRLNAAGDRDNGFSTAAFQDYETPAIIYTVAELPDGKLLIGGTFHSLGGATVNNLVRLQASGAMDGTFNSAGAGSSAFNVATLAVRPSDGKIFAGGYFSSYGGEARGNMAWLNADGSVDSTLAGLAGATDASPEVHAIAVQPDGRIVVGGFFSSVNGAPRYNLVRLYPGSTIDPSFNPQIHGSVRSVFLQPNGKILIAGNIKAVNGTARGRVARLNADGSLDTSFDTGTGANNTVFAVTADAAGNIYIGGTFGSYSGAFPLNLAKLTPSGGLDPNFSLDGVNGPVRSIATPDGAGGIVIGGSFTAQATVTARRIARVNTSTGVIDTSFNPGAAGPGSAFNSQVNTVVLGPDGKYYVGGNFSSFNGTPRARVARLNSNGSLDTTFAGPPLNQTVLKVLPQNGKVYVGGNGFLTPPSLFRLNDTGSLDSSFDAGASVQISPATAYQISIAEIGTLAVQADGKLLVGGIFNQYNGTPRIALARLTGPDNGTPVPVAALGNISTRLRVETGDNALIGGFIVSGAQPKKVIIRGIGPSLATVGIAQPLANPTLELHGPNGLIDSNEDWMNSPDKQAIIDSGIPPSNNLESAIVKTLPANNTGYTAILRGANNGTGIGVVEIYDLDTAGAARMANISTRGFVQTGENVLIAGMIVVGQGPRKVIIRAIGPSLSLAGTLNDPFLELRDENGALVESNDNWGDSPNKQAILDSTIPPSHPAEAAIVQSLPGGNARFTAIVRGVNATTGIALVEVYGID